MRGAGFLAIWSDVEQKALTDYRHWLTREHTTERVTTKGFLAVRVFRAERADINRFFILYELEAPEVLDGPAYWRVSMRRRHGRNASCRSSAISSAAAASWRPAPAAARAPPLPRCGSSNSPKRRNGWPTHIVALDGIAAVQIGVDRPGADIGADSRKGNAAAGRVLCRPVDHRGAGRGVAARRAARGGRDGARPLPGGEAEVYRGMFALDARIADFG